jgi:hypothetical protein
MAAFTLNIFLSDFVLVLLGKRKYYNFLLQDSEHDSDDSEDYGKDVVSKIHVLFCTNFTVMFCDNMSSLNQNISSSLF